MLGWEEDTTGPAAARFYPPSSRLLESCIDCFNRRSDFKHCFESDHHSDIWLYGISLCTLICDIAYALFHTVFASKSLKHAGFGSKVLPIVPLWGTGIFVTVIVLAIMAIYPYRVIRFLIVVAAIIVAVIF